MRSCHLRRIPAHAIAGALLAGVLLAPAPGQAQPSGGPYGPVAQTYEVPKYAAHVYYVAPDGQVGRRRHERSTRRRPSRRSSRASSRATRSSCAAARTGRAASCFNQGITLQPYRDEVPVLKGTRVATKWEPLRNGVWRTPWTTLFPQRPADWWQRDREGMRTPLHRFNNDMVFVDGEFLQSAGWEGELDAHSYSIDYEGGYVYIAVDPKDTLVEITAFDSAIVRTTKPVHGRTSDRKGPVIRGPHLHPVRVPRAGGGGHRARRPGGPRAPSARTSSARRSST